MKESLSIRSLQFSVQFQLVLSILFLTALFIEGIGLAIQLPQLFRNGSPRARLYAFTAPTAFLISFIAVRVLWARVRERNYSVLYFMRSFKFWRYLLYSFFFSFVISVFWAPHPEETMRAILHLIGLFSIYAVAGLPGAQLFKKCRDWLDIPLFNLLIFLILAEVFFRIASLTSNAFIFADEDSPATNVKRWKAIPGTISNGMVVNSEGFVDKPFSTEKKPGVFRIAVIGDSFAVGPVPYHYNFITLLENHLNTIPFAKEEHLFEVYNFGIPAIGLPEYRYLYESTIKKYNPDYLIICFFVGNDICTIPPKRHFFNKHFWSLYKFPIRIYRILQEYRHQSKIQAILNDPVKQQNPPWIENPELEPPGFSEEAFLQVEFEKLPYFKPHQREENYTETFRLLSRMKREIQIPWHLVLIPDELQVNDALYNQLLTMDGNTAQNLVRYYPQKRLKEFAEKLDIPTLDLLDALCSAEKSKGRTYHLRDTHWNAHGNRVAAREIFSHFVQIYESVN